MSELVRSYYTGVYIQKSKATLLPLVEVDYTRVKKAGLVNTYLYCEGIEESILDNCILVEFRKGSEYEGNEYTKASYTTEEETEILVYSLDHVADDIQHFLRGQYSRFSEESKRHLLKYYGFNPPPKPEDVKNGKQHQPGWYVIMYPGLFKAEVSDEFWQRYGLYTTYDEAYNVVKGMKEFLPLFDLDKETLNKKINS